MAIRLLKKSKPHLRLLISYADPKQGHHGGLYQSLGFVYSGLTKPNHNTVGVHKRTLHDTHGGSVRGQSYRYVKEVKHKYLLALDASLDDAINKLKVPYPTREKHNMVVQQSSRLQETVRV